MEEESVPLAVAVARLEVKVDQLIELNTTRGRDHENRIRALERWKYALPVSAFGAILSAVVSVVLIIATRR